MTTKRTARTSQATTKRRTDAVCAAIDALQLADEHADGGELPQALEQLERARGAIDAAERVLRGEAGIG